jgi:phytol kinase
LIFSYVFIIQINFSLPGTFIVGWAVTTILILAIKLGEGNILYEAIAREQDAPYRSRYIIYSYLATFGGGVLTNLLFGKFYAIFGYLITGIGDAVAEPIGVLFGKHRYRVINFDKKEAYRSVEGSAAVFIATFLVLLICAYFMPEHLMMNIPRIFYCSVICTIIEAVSPQGWDNLLMQLAGGLSVFLFLYQ